MKGSSQSTEDMGSIKLIPCFSSANSERDFTLASTSRLFFNVLFVDAQLETNSSSLSRQFWHVDYVFVSRFMAGISSHFGMSAT